MAMLNNQRVDRNKDWNLPRWNHVIFLPFPMRKGDTLQMLFSMSIVPRSSKLKKHIVIAHALAHSHPNPYPLPAFISSYFYGSLHVETPYHPLSSHMGHGKTWIFSSFDPLACYGCYGSWFSSKKTWCFRSTWPTLWVYWNHILDAYPAYPCLRSVDSNPMTSLKRDLYKWVCLSKICLHIKQDSIH